VNPRRHIAKTLSALCASLWIGIAGAQANYPDKPITVIVPFPPGVVDGYARLVATKAGTLLGQPMVIRNQAGAGQRIGTDALAKAPKDGYTIGVITNAGVVSGPVLAQNVPYDPVKDLSYLTMIFESHYLVNTHPASGIKTLPQLLEQAKASPGKIKFGSTGMGTGFHLATEQFVMSAGIKALHVPYRGESPLTTDLIGGQVDFAFSSMANRSLAEQGKLVMLAYTGDKRSPLIPNVPTVKELGIPHVSSGWLGFAVPAGVPAPIREKLIAALTSAVNDPEVVANFTKGGGEPRNLSGDAFAARVKREIDELREMNKDLKLSIE
jgi:tripartite-type tricarboxylate transporter receptor subunit TctC